MPLTIPNKVEPVAMAKAKLRMVSVKSSLDRVRATRSEAREWLFVR